MIDCGWYYGWYFSDEESELMFMGLLWPSIITASLFELIENFLGH